MHFFSCHFQKHPIYKGIISDVQIKQNIFFIVIDNSIIQGCQK